MKLFKPLSLITSLFISLASFARATYNSLYVMPDEDELAKRLNVTLDGTYFNDKTNLARKLGGQQRSVFAVNVTVELALHEFRNVIKDPCIRLCMAASKYNIMSAILKDNPAALKELAELADEVTGKNFHGLSL